MAFATSVEWLLYYVQDIGSAASALTDAVWPGGMRIGICSKVTPRWSTPAPTVASISWAMNGSIGSIVLTVATSPIATKRIVSAMNDNILAYCSAMAQARRMLSLRLITKEEYGKIDTMMLHKYGLSLGSLFRDMTLIAG